jgi:hypothetical protein
MAWQLAVGSFEYARGRGDPHAADRAEQAMVDRYAAYLLARDQLEKGVMPAA